MVVDSSAIVAILTGEPEASALLAAAEAAGGGSLERVRAAAEELSAG